MVPQAETDLPVGTGTDHLRLTAEVVKAFVSNGAVHASSADVSEMIAKVHATLTTLGAPPPAPEPPRPEPAVPIRTSVQREYIVCLEDGKRLRTLKRYLATQFGMTPDDYRRKWNLPPDYPMTAPAYRERRSELAKQLGLGRKPVTRAAVPEPVEPEPTTGTARGSRAGARRQARAAAAQPRSRRRRG